MTQAQHTPPSTQSHSQADDHELSLAIRRHTDRCFHAVEEFVPGPHGGYIVQGVLIHQDDIAEVRSLSDTPTCDVPKAIAPSTSEHKLC